MSEADFGREPGTGSTANQSGPGASEGGSTSSKGNRASKRSAKSPRPSSRPSKKAPEKKDATKDSQSSLRTSRPGSARSGSGRDSSRDSSRGSGKSSGQDSSRDNSAKPRHKNTESEDELILSVGELVMDVFENFVDTLTVIQCNYKPDEGLREVKFIVCGAARIMETTGKKLVELANGLGGKAGDATRSTGEVMIKSAKLSKSPYYEIEQAVDLITGMMTDTFQELKQLHKSLRGKEDYKKEKEVRIEMERCLMKLGKLVDDVRAKTKTVDGEYPDREDRD